MTVRETRTGQLYTAKDIFRPREKERVKIPRSLVTTWAGLISGPRSDMPYSISKTFAMMRIASSKASRVFILSFLDDSAI